MTALVLWLSFIFGSFAVSAPPNRTIVTVLFVCVFSASAAIFLILALPGIEWVILGDHRAGSMQVRTLRRRYSSSRNP